MEDTCFRQVAEQARAFRKSMKIGRGPKREEVVAAARAAMEQAFLQSEETIENLPARPSKALYGEIAVANLEEETEQIAEPCGLDLRGSIGKTMNEQIGPVFVTRAVLDGVLEVRRSGLTGMFDYEIVAFGCSAGQR